MSNPTDRQFYESEKILSEYLLFHYGSAADTVSFPFAPWEALDFPVRCITKCLDPAILPAAARALDLGCAVGRSSFELARHATEVVGIDNSSRFIEAAKHLRKHGCLDFACRTEGDLTVPRTASVPSEIARERVHFQVGDALNLPSTLGSFDIVLLANLIDRLPNPATLLRRLPSLLNPNGQLILISPYTWMEDFTPREEWLGGFEREGKEVTTFDSLQHQLGTFFELISRQDLPFLIREHSRKYQWSVADATVWRRREQAQP